MRSAFVWLLSLGLVACDESTGPAARPLPPGEYHSWRTLFLQVAPPPAQPGGPGCVGFRDGKLIVETDGSVRLTRRFARDLYLPETIHHDTLSGDQQAIHGSAAMELRFGAWSDTALLQSEPEREVVYLRQHFPESSACAAMTVVLEYVRP